MLDLVRAPAMLWTGPVSPDADGVGSMAKSGVSGGRDQGSSLELGSAWLFSNVNICALNVWIELTGSTKFHENRLHA